MGRPLSQTATDEVNDLEAIPRVETSSSPAIARNDVMVQFDCYAIGFHSELLNQGGESERGLEVA